MSEAGVILYVTPGCHLCHDAAETLERLGVRFDQIDASGDPGRFLRVPIVEVGGLVVAEGPVEAQSLRSALRRLGLLKRFPWSSTI
ncbi:MAG: hypothetical protein NVSMB57_08240 [Actinomycetota bacterium]